MSFTKCAILVAIACVPLTLAAQQKNPPPDPADAKAVVEAYVVESAFRNYQSMATPAATPDTIWQSANKDLGKVEDAPMDHSNHQHKGK